MCHRLAPCTVCWPLQALGGWIIRLYSLWPPVTLPTAQSQGKPRGKALLREVGRNQTGGGESRLGVPGDWPETPELTPQGHILNWGGEVVRPDILPPTEGEEPHKRGHLEGPPGFQELSRWGSGNSPWAGTPKGVTVTRSGKRQARTGAPHSVGLSLTVISTPPLRTSELKCTELLSREDMCEDLSWSHHVSLDT